MAKLTKKQIQYKKWANWQKPRPSLSRNLFVAFVVGGFICILGQAILNYFVSTGMSQQKAGGPTAAVMIFFGALLTGIGVYDDIGRFAGAGSIIPITGFANSIVASAIDYKREGYVTGVGAKMFTVAGPILVYGMTSAWVVGLIYWLIHK